MHARTQGTSVQTENTMNLKRLSGSDRRSMIRGTNHFGAQLGRNKTIPANLWVPQLQLFTACRGKPSMTYQCRRFLFRSSDCRTYFSQPERGVYTQTLLHAHCSALAVLRGHFVALFFALWARVHHDRGSFFNHRTGQGRYL